MSEAIEVASMFMGISLAIISVIFLMIVIAIIDKLNRKSKQYRETLADMYVSSKIKQLADKEGLDLAVEFESFKKWLKKLRLSEKSLDNAVESELKDKLAEELPKKTKTKE